ncbi:hypothetical protein PIB30_051388 [Stylosanthes scabra]|uniref:Uncharacterized protein n=1 Tax=Stylosanthes scabra TaxID=79078 RepID=A0ABU6THM6_9FABA|nr:hypothetical protein [Stylosanthes scabra]
MIYYRLPISVVAHGERYGCFAIKVDDDLQVLFHCRKQFPELLATELFVEMRIRIHIPQMLQGRLALRSSMIQRRIRSFGELAVAIAAAPYLVSVLVVERDPESLVEEALRANDSDNESEFIEGQ